MSLPFKLPGQKDPNPATATATTWHLAPSAAEWPQHQQQPQFHQPEHGSPQYHPPYQPRPQFDQEDRRPQQQFARYPEIPTPHVGDLPFGPHSTQPHFELSTGAVHAPPSAPELPPDLARSGQQPMLSPQMLVEVPKLEPQPWVGLISVHACVSSCIP